MVLMYHNIGDKEDKYERESDQFMKDLEELYQKGYETISLKEYVKGKINLPLGKTPYILTFDDAEEGNFRYLKNGEIDPNCAIGILLRFRERHPDVRTTASFYANGPKPFEDENTVRKKINFLLENDFDLGNHTLTHPKLSSLSPQEVMKEVGNQAKFLENQIDINKNYKINTLAIPYGDMPSDEILKENVAKGSLEGYTYENIGILGVCSGPSYSPYLKSFNPLKITRVKGSEMDKKRYIMRTWIDYFERFPEQKFISDGFQERITIRKDNLSDLKELNDLKIVAY